MPFPRRRPYVASPDQVRITRESDAVVIEYSDPEIATTRFAIGEERAATMTDEEVLKLWNDGIVASDEHRRSLTYVATEIPVGRNQLERSELTGALAMRGDIVRCIIEGRPEASDDLFVSVDNHDLTLREFVQMLEHYEGWGMRIEIVPHDELHLRPKRRIKDGRKRSSFRRRTT